jgi:hypothetical protein
METEFAKRMKEPAPADGAPLDLDRECEAWDWARTAGLSAQDLRKAVRESLDGRPT